ncbi:LPS export ABC transporter periplasmic protein LptC [Alkalilimnicola sp. S0819]|uniref:LPS export ABC transporter periplasmic protein LptC n=1 Tax=Alkalilimnicola sp. S0819 TaxID=2613922 RepID=UPI001261AD87|nr:LPS export ABC transporter periplasmic protein LptC [Alkalilimnicola sp. S0819]KAB7623824.1 LPS export ABC transporter periplasmic protein LptC [Alkalilimnicola sp. S0819]MPQ16699.1 LPS export ABC transporter periplasmic protein LptC [Alkalilimnicola sp. S0819]
MRRTRLFPAVTLIILVALAWWLSRDRDESRDAADAAAVSVPDAFFEGFRLRSTDATGRWDYQVDSPRVAHYPEDDRWTLATPRLEAYPEEGATWHAHAEQGIAWPDEDRVELRGRVTVRRAASPVNRPLELDTENVRITPSRDYAETDAYTEVRQGVSRIQGTGARAWVAEDRVEFLSEVKGHYVPEDQ